MLEAMKHFVASRALLHAEKPHLSSALASASSLQTPALNQVVKPVSRCLATASAVSGPS
jgi:hypothetical protein